MCVVPFRSKDSASVITEQMRVDYDSYLAANGCGQFSITGIVITCKDFYCGKTGQEPDGTVSLGGYEVLVEMEAVNYFGDGMPVHLYYHTESLEMRDEALRVFSPGAALLVKSGIWCIAPPTLTLYLDALSQVQTVPDHHAGVLRNMVIN